MLQGRRKSCRVDTGHLYWRLVSNRSRPGAALLVCGLLLRHIRPVSVWITCQILKSHRRQCGPSIRARHCQCQSRTSRVSKESHCRLCMPVYDSSQSITSHERDKVYCRWRATVNQRHQRQALKRVNERTYTPFHSLSGCCGGGGRLGAGICPQKWPDNCQKHSLTGPFHRHIHILVQGQAFTRTPGQGATTNARRSTVRIESSISAS